VGLFEAADPVAGMVGGPISGWIMAAMVGVAGLLNWQWLFIFEGIPSIILGLVALVIVVDTPAQARWLSEREKRLILADLEADRRQAGPRKHGFSEALRTPGVWILTLIYFCLVSANPTLGFWGPTIIKNMGVKSDSMIGLLSAVPYVVAIVALVLVGRSSDRMLERRYHTALSCLAAAVGLVLIGVFAHTPLAAFAAFVLAVVGVLSAFAPFWQMPTLMLASTGAAVGIALINSIGNLSGWLGPFFVGWFMDRTGATSGGLYVVAGIEALAAVLILLFIPQVRRSGNNGPSLSGELTPGG
jgi:nitrate/nitrite transporter NarK